MKENNNIFVNQCNFVVEHNYSIEFELDDIFVANVVESINNKLDSVKEDEETMLDIKDIDENVVSGYINIGSKDIEFNEDIIINKVETELLKLNIEFDRHIMPSTDGSEYYFPIIFTNITKNINEEFKELNEFITQKIEKSLNFVSFIIEVFDNKYQISGYVSSIEDIEVIKSIFANMELNCKNNKNKFVVELSKNGFFNKEDGIYYKDDFHYYKMNCDVYGY